MWPDEENFTPPTFGRRFPGASSLFNSAAADTADSAAAAAAGTAVSPTVVWALVWAAVCAVESPPRGAAAHLTKWHQRCRKQNRSGAPHVLRVRNFLASRISSFWIWYVPPMGMGRGNEKTAKPRKPKKAVLCGNASSRTSAKSQRNLLKIQNPPQKTPPQISRAPQRRNEAAPQDTVSHFY